MNRGLGPAHPCGRREPPLSLCWGTPRVLATGKPWDLPTSVSTGASFQRRSWLPVRLEASVGLSCNQWRASESVTASVGVLSSGSSSQICHGLRDSSASVLQPRAGSLLTLSPGTMGDTVWDSQGQGTSMSTIPAHRELSSCPSRNRSQDRGSKGACVGLLVNETEVPGVGHKQSLWAVPPYSPSRTLFRGLNWVPPGTEKITSSSYAFYPDLFNYKTGVGGGGEGNRFHHRSEFMLAGWRARGCLPPRAWCLDLNLGWITQDYRGMRCPTQKVFFNTLPFKH